MQESQMSADKRQYVEGVEPDTIVAFTTENGDTKSAKVVENDSEKRELLLVTAYGKEYLAKYDDVIWVKTGSRWPRGVYNALKGNGKGAKDA